MDAGFYGLKTRAGHFVNRTITPDVKGFFNE
jgi:hypothetical protein